MNTKIMLNDKKLDNMETVEKIEKIEKINTQFVKIIINGHKSIVNIANIKMIYYSERFECYRLCLKNEEDFQIREETASKLIDLLATYDITE